VSRALKLLLAGAAGAVILALAALALRPDDGLRPLSAHAASTSAPSTPAASMSAASTSAASTARSAGDVAQRIRERRDEALAALGRRLGVSTGDLATGVRGVLADRLQQAVDRGRVTAEQRQALLRAYDTGDPRAAKQALGLPRERRQARREAREARRAARQSERRRDGRQARHHRGDGRQGREGPRAGEAPNATAGKAATSRWARRAARVRAARDRLFADLGRRIGRTGPQVAAAVRAEIAARLQQAVGRGWMPRELADGLLRAYDQGQVRGVGLRRGLVGLVGLKGLLGPGALGGMRHGGALGGMRHG
jgi:hypothetical protein